MRFWETPVHIPNTMVKTKAADDTILVTVWESRWLPDQKKNNWFYQWSEDSKSWGFWWLINIQSDSNKSIEKCRCYGNCEAISNANEVRYCTLKTSYRRFWWKWFFIKTSENIVNKVYDQTKRTKVQDRSNSIRVIKCKDPVSNAIETVNEVKQKRAQGGCLGTKSRWKTW